MTNLACLALGSVLSSSSISISLLDMFCGGNLSLSLSCDSCSWGLLAHGVLQRVLKEHIPSLT
jgi:hypothetical protein